MPTLIDIPGRGRVRFPDGVSDEEIKAALAREFPPTGKDIYEHAASNPKYIVDKMTEDDFKLYKQYKGEKHTDWLDTFVAGAGYAGGTLLGAVGAAVTSPAKSIQSVPTSFVVGTTDLIDFGKSVFGDDNLENLKRGARWAIEREETVKAAPSPEFVEGASFITDPTMFVPGINVARAGSKFAAVGLKAGGKGARVVESLGQKVSALAHMPENLAARATLAVTDDAAMAQKAASLVSQGSLYGAGADIALGVSVPGLASVATPIVAGKLAGKTLSTVGEAGAHLFDSWASGPQRLGAFERLAADAAAGAGARALGKVGAKLGADTAAELAGSAIKGSAEGALIGGVLGGLANGEEGFFQGLGAGTTLGAFGGVVGRGVMKLSGADHAAGVAANLANVVASREDGVHMQTFAQRAKGVSEVAKMLDLTAQVESLGVRVVFHDNSSLPGDTALLGQKYAGATVKADSIKPATVYLNVDNIRDGVVPHEVFHAIATEGHLKQLRDTLLGERVNGEVVRPGVFGENDFKQFAEAYMKKLSVENRAVMQSQLVTALDKSAAPAARWEAQRGIVDEVGASYAQAWAKAQKADTFLAGRIPTVYSQLFSLVSDKVSNKLALGAQRSGFDFSKGVDAGFSDASGKRIRVPELDKMVKSMFVPGKAFEPAKTKISLGRNLAESMALVRAIGAEDLVVATKNGARLKTKEELKAEHLRNHAVITSRLAAVPKDQQGGARIIADVADRSSGTARNEDVHIFSRENPASSAQVEAIVGSGIYNQAQIDHIRRAFQSMARGDVHEVGYLKATEGGKAGVFEHSMREMLPYSIEVNKANVLYFRSVDITKVRSRLDAAFARPEFKGVYGSKGEAWSALSGEYLRNLSEASSLPSADVLGGGALGEKRRNFFYEVMGTVPRKDTVLANPAREGYVSSRKGGSVYESFRFERVTSMVPTAEAVPFSAGRSYQKSQINFLPDAAETGAKGNVAEDYRMQHRPNSEGPQAHDLLSTDLAPRDIYDRPDFYTGEPGSVGYKESVAALRKIRGKPDAEITVYRASPQNTLNEGDWVSFSKSYSKQHGMADNPSDDVPVHAFKVKARDVRWAGDTLEEFGYYPEKKPTPAAETGARFMPEDADRQPAFYSRLNRTVEQSQQNKASGAQWKATIKNSKLGANADEMALVGIHDLEDGKTYSKQEVLDYLRANEVVVKDVTLGGGVHPELAWVENKRKGGSDGWHADDNKGASWEVLAVGDGKWRVYRNGNQYENESHATANEAKARAMRDADVAPTHFQNYQLPGAVEGSYREVLLTVPKTEMAKGYGHRVVTEGRDTYIIRNGDDQPMWEGRDVTAEDIARLKDAYEKPDTKFWRDGHSQYASIANPIVRLRHNERTTADGKRLLFLEEIQAPQKGEFEKMPALFQKNWREIAFKWALRHAAENGFDAVGWTTGEQQAARYDLSKQVSAVTWNESNGQLAITDHDGKDQTIKSDVKAEDLDEIVGKDAAQKLRDTEESEWGNRKISGLDLKVGGEGLRKLYDSDFRNVVNGLPAVKKSGQKVGTAEIQGTNPGVAEKGFTITQSRTGSTWTIRKITQDPAYVGEGSGGLVGDVVKSGFSSRQEAARWADENIKIPGVPIHSLTLAPAIRESVMGGQARFQPADTDYLAAVKSGDMKVVQGMVDAAAKAAGYDVGPVFHGTDKKGLTEIYGGWWSDTKKVTREFGNERYSAYLKGPLADGDTLRDLYKKFNGTDIDPDSDSPLYDSEIADSAMSGGPFSRFVKEEGFRGIEVWDESNAETGMAYSAFDPSQIKSADPITRDDSGAVIPLSKRFNTKREDIRFMPYAGESASLPQFMRDALDTAKAMAAAGKSSEEIRAVTGWFPGKYDGKMRFEVPDEGVTLVESKDWIAHGGSTSTERGSRLKDVINHPELLAAYPEVGNVTVDAVYGHVDGKGLPREGSYTHRDPKIHGDGARPTIKARGATKAQVLSTILHEVQHWIQEKEGFARGAHPDMWKAKHHLLHQKVESLNAHMKQKLSEGNKEEYRAAMSERDDVVQEILGLEGRDGIVGADQYQRTAGEIESRDVQARQKFTPEQRKAVAPYSSENIAKEAAIVLTGRSNTKREDIRFMPVASFDEPMSIGSTTVRNHPAGYRTTQRAGGAVRLYGKDGALLGVHGTVDEANGAVVKAERVGQVRLEKVDPRTSEVPPAYQKSVAPEDIVIRKTDEADGVIRKSSHLTESGTPAPDTKTSSLPTSGVPIKWADSARFIPVSERDAFSDMTPDLLNDIERQTSTIAGIHIDRMRVGSYKGEDLQGGMFYPTIQENLGKRAVWAFNSPGVARGVARRAAENGGYVKLILMQEGNVIGNKTFTKIWFNELAENIGAGRLSERRALSELNRVRTLNKKETGHSTPWTSLAQAKSDIIEMPQIKRGASYFMKSLRTTKTERTKVAYESLLAKKMSDAGFPDAKAIVDAIEEPAFKNVPKGASVAILKIDPIEPNSEIATAKSLGIPEHTSYKYVLQGEPVAKLTHYNVVDDTFPDTKNKIWRQQAVDYPLRRAIATAKSAAGKIDYSKK